MEDKVIAHASAMANARMDSFGVVMVLSWHASVTLAQRDRSYGRKTKRPAPPGPDGRVTLAVGVVVLER
jgi:hypothetical protein